MPDAQPADYNDPDPLVRIHARLDSLIEAVGHVDDRVAKVDRCVATIQAVCGPCQETIRKHDVILHGNGKDGLLERVAVSEQGRVDTLSVKSVCVLVGAIGTLAATIGAAMAALVK